MTDKEKESGFDEMMTVGFYDSVTVMAEHGSTVPPGKIIYPSFLLLASPEG